MYIVVIDIQPGFELIAKILGILPVYRVDMKRISWTLSQEGG